MMVCMTMYISCNTSGGVSETSYHAYVDLGLPSGLLWATCNVGANRPDDYGNYYAWGETKNNKIRYKWSRGKSKLTKYNTNPDYGIVDNKEVLDSEDDVAHVNWGGKWRMPTEAELQELIDNCTWRWWIMQNGVKGVRVTGSNGNSIFLPAAGFHNVGGDIGIGSGGDYWSSSLNTDNPNTACKLRFGSGYVDMINIFGERTFGLSVRPVCSPQ